jgi:bacterioferritin-associated ferredoxin
MIVCLCKNINETELKKLLKDKSVEHIMNTTGLCTKCKSCRETVRRIVLENAVESCSMRM